MSKNWKPVERKIAALLGGERVPVTGRARGDVPDVRHDQLSIEVKSWKNLPSRVADAMAQAVAAIRGNQLPIVVIHKDGTLYDNSLVVMKMKDFREEVLPLIQPTTAVNCSEAG